jgi:hypothetical protein
MLDQGMAGGKPPPSPGALGAGLGAKGAGMSSGSALALAAAWSCALFSADDPKPPEMEKDREQVCTGDSDLLIWGPERVEGLRTYLHAETGFGEFSSEEGSIAWWEMEMVPSLIAQITWHLPGGRYHSPSIIAAHRRRCYAPQQLDQCRA